MSEDKLEQQEGQNEQEQQQQTPEKQDAKQEEQQQSPEVVLKKTELPEQQQQSPEVVLKKIELPEQQQLSPEDVLKKTELLEQQPEQLQQEQPQLPEQQSCQDKPEVKEASKELPSQEQQDKQPEIKTKQNYRERIWVHMAKEKLTNSLRSLCNKIPYFHGHDEATKRLTAMDEFKEAKLLMISPDKPQESVIISSLLAQKEVLIPKPKLYNGLFYCVKNATNLPEEETKDAVVRYDIKQLQTPVNYDKKDLKVDMIVLGSVCVNKSGYRIGDGEGFVDLEYAILSKMKAVNENTLIVTTVHDCQILEDLPIELFEPHDVPVDIIVTPTQTIVVNPKLNKPNQIIWSIISKRRLASIPILSKIKESEEKAGTTVSLKEDDSDVEARLKEKIRVKRAITKLKPRTRRIKATSENDNTKEIRRKPFIRKKRLQKSKENNDINNSADKPTNEGDKTPAKPMSKPRRHINSARHQIDFSLRLSNIASTVRVRDLKSALLERGVKPSNITWRGQRGFCYLHFGKLRKRDSPEDQPIQVDSIMANLRQLKIGDQTPEAPSAFITVEPAEPVTRIEVTDVTAV